MIGNETKLKSLDRFCEIAKEKNIHINVCLAVASIILNSEDWENDAKEITKLAEESPSADEFADLIVKKY